MKKTNILLMMTFLLIFTLSVVDAAAYIKFDGVDGEAKDPSHEGWSEISSFSQAIHQPSGGATGIARRRGSVIMEDIIVTKELDKSSPKLQEGIALGTRFPKVEIDLTTSYGDGERETYYRYELENVMVTSYSVSGSGDFEELPTEEMTLNYEKIKVTYKELDETGGQRSIVEFIWNLLQGRTGR